MPADFAEFHEEAAAEYDAAFDWYLARSPDAALKFDAEVARAFTQILRLRSVGLPVLTLLAGSCSDSFLLF